MCLGYYCLQSSISSTPNPTLSANPQSHNTQQFGATTAQMACMKWWQKQASRCWESLFILGWDGLQWHERASPAQSSFLLLSLSLSLSLSSSASSDSLFKKCNYSKGKQSQLLWQQNALELAWGHLLTWEWQNTAFGRIKCRIRPFSLISHEYLRSDLHFRHSVPFHSEITFDQDVLFHCQSLLKDFTSLIAALVMCDRARFALIRFFLLLLDGARK